MMLVHCTLHSKCPALSTALNSYHVLHLALYVALHAAQYVALHLALLLLHSSLLVRHYVTHTAKRLYRVVLSQADGR